jgi:hypothetical protein
MPADKTTAPVDMTNLSVDFTNVSTGFPVLADGDYPATIAEAELKASKNGNPMIEVTYSLDQGGKQWDRYSLLPQALFRVKQLALRAGIPEASLNKELNIAELCKDLKNRKVVLRIITEEYDGEDRNRVKEVLASDGKGGASAAKTKRGW